MSLSRLTFLRLAFKYRENPIYHYYLKGRKCLDVACGEGKLLKLDPENFVGIDINPDLVRKNKEQNLNVHICSCTDMFIFEDESFDVVNCANIIEHLNPDDAVKFLNESSRVLKKGGCIIIDTPSENNIWNTFSHIKPYPPIAIQKLLVRVTEDYLSSKSQLIKLNLESVFYKGFSWSKIGFFIYMMYFSFSRRVDSSRPVLCNGYCIILRKGE